jgi:gamma-glutamyltranspeptidase/glutathione hydrolase
LPVTVPGADGWFELFELVHGHGHHLPSRLCGEWFSVTELIGYLNLWYQEQGYENIEDTYITQNGGNVPAEGEIFRNPYLAETYRKISKGGREAFYRGEIAEIISAFIKEQGGFLSKEDFKEHRSEWVDPVSINYRGYDIWELPPNGQGIAALQMLQILKQYDFSEIEFGSVEHLHLFTEAKKLAFEDRAKYYADMEFTKVPVDILISEEYAKQRKEQITVNASSYEAGEIGVRETIYRSPWINGNIVSLIRSNNE